MKKTFLIILFFSLCAVTFGQEKDYYRKSYQEQKDREDAKRSAYDEVYGVGGYGNLGVNALFGNGSWGFHADLALFDFYAAINKSNTENHHNDWFAVSINQPVSIFFNDDAYGFFVTPKIGIGYMWNRIMDNDNTSRNGGVYLNIHPQIGYAIEDLFCIRIGYWYPAYKFTFDTPGYWTIGLSIPVFGD